MRPVRLKIMFMIVCGLLLLTNISLAQTVTNLTQNTTHGTDIQNAIDSANTGDVIELSNGTYPLVSTLNVNKSVTIQGESETGVTLDASGMTPITNYVIRTVADTIQLQTFTIIPISDPDSSADNNIGYTIKGGSNSGNTINKNLSLISITIEGAERAPFDIHGVDGVILTDLTANNTTRGNGISISGCIDVEISGFSGSNNAWGAIGIYASRYFNRGSDNVTIDGPSLSIAEDPPTRNSAVYSEDDRNPIDGHLFNTNITVTDWCYTVTNPQYPAFTGFAGSREEAKIIADGVDNYQGVDLSSIITEDQECIGIQDLPLMNGPKKAGLMLIVLGFAIVVGYRRLA